MHTALEFRSYVGDESIAGMQQGLFKDRGILRMLGVTAVELEMGFDSDRNGGENTPCHVDSLRNRVQGIVVLWMFWEDTEADRGCGKDASGIAGHLFYDTLSYNMIGVYRQRRARQLIDRGIRRLRREMLGSSRS